MVVSVFFVIKLIYIYFISLFNNPTFSVAYVVVIVFNFNHYHVIITR